MAKAHITLPNGTVVAIEGTTDEIERLLTIYSDPPSQPTGHSNQPRKFTQIKANNQRGEKKTSPDAPSSSSGDQIDLMEIVNLVKTCDQSEAIENAVLDHLNIMNRVLLPLFIVHEHKGNSIGLTSGEIGKITKQLGVPVSQPNASRCLSGSAKPYVIGDSIRIKGQPVRYKLSRRGLQYFRECLTQKSNIQNGP